MFNHFSSHFGSFRRGLPDLEQSTQSIACSAVEMDTARVLPWKPPSNARKVL